MPLSQHSLVACSFTLSFVSFLLQLSSTPPFSFLFLLQFCSVFPSVSYSASYSFSTLSSTLFSICRSSLLLFGCYCIFYLSFTPYSIHLLSVFLHLSLHLLSIFYPSSIHLLSISYPSSILAFACLLSNIKLAPIITPCSGIWF